MGNIKFSRVTGWATSDTFQCAPIGRFVRKYLEWAEVSVDPFARNCGWATYTNDLNPNTTAQYHMDALDFLAMMHGQGVQADLVIMDPPFSPRQLKECYDNIGKKMGQTDAHRTTWTAEREVIDKILKPGGMVLFFGWNSTGMGLVRPYTIEEIMLVTFGACHNDVICMAQRKSEYEQLGLFKEE